MEGDPRDTAEEKRGIPVSSHATQTSDDRLAAQLRGFGPLGLLAILLILLTGSIQIAPMVPVPVGALLVLAWVKLSHTPWSAIGYVRPPSWPLTIAGGILVGVALKVAMKMIVMPLLGADPVNHAYHFLTGNRALLPAAIYTMLNAGFAEETIFRGFGFERLRKLLGNGPAARIAILSITSLVFGLAHYGGQGLAGAEQATVTGLVVGIMVMATGRIWMAMIAHAAFDLTALAMIYFDVEAKIAHTIFK